MKDYIKFPEQIVKVVVEEMFGLDSSKLESLVINDKLKIIPTNNSEKPFKKIKMREKDQGFA